MQEEKQTDRISTELEIENMQEFLNEHQDIKLGNLPTYEDLIKPKTETEMPIKDMKTADNVPVFEFNKKVEKQQDVAPINQKRFKIAVGCFALVGSLIALLVCINGVALAVMSNDIKDNQKQITTLTQEVEELEYEYELQNPSTPEDQKVSYKLAFPRNYPKDTSELTWFDKLSIFLMKLFG